MILVQNFIKCQRSINANMSQINSKIEAEVTLLNPLYEAFVTLMPILHKDQRIRFTKQFLL